MSALSKGGGSEHSAAKGLDTRQRQTGFGAPLDALDSGLVSNVSSDPESSFKSRRINKACDECRGRKVKCDGRRPCLPCSSLDMECTYDQPDKRTTRLSRREVDELRLKLQRARSILNALLPDLDVDDPNLDAEILSKVRMPATKVQSPATTGVKSPDSTLQGSHHTVAEHDVQLETVLDATGRLDLDELGNWRYQGHGSSSAFMRRLGERFGDVSDPGLGKNTVLRLRSMPDIFESPADAEDRPYSGSMPDFIPLPPRQVALDLISCALNEACSILNFIHQPTFYSLLDRMYLVNPEQYGYDENKFLPLLYASLAVGYLFSNSEQVNFGYAHAVSEGTKYFAASRQMLPITECRDLCSLQAIIFMIMFLQSSASMSTCHSYVSAAMAACLQMGLHQTLNEAMNPIERETRKRIFWTIRTMDTYIVAILGLPRTVRDDDIDQEMPVEVDDQYITKDGILPMPDGQISVIAGFNAHTRLIQVLGKVVTDVYPTKRIQNEASAKTRAYVVSDAKVREVERDLQHWGKSLPMHFRPGADSAKGLLRVQHLLRLAFTHVQIVLYKPFLHYISYSKTDTPTSGQCYAYAAACVDVGRNVIHNARQLEMEGTLNVPHWFAIYTTFCATLSLVFYVWENAEVEGTLQTLKDAEYGRDILGKLAYKSTAAGSHSETLAIIFSRLPARLGKVQWKQSKIQRKRHQLLSTEDESRGFKGHGDVTEPNHSPYEALSQNESSIASQPSTQPSDSLDLDDSLLLQTPFDPQYFISNPEMPMHPNVARFLGPNSIEDIFGAEPQYSGDVDSPNPGYTTMNAVGTFKSLDQYVSTLDLQGQLAPSSISGTADGESSLDWDATAVDNASHPFIPLSPYLMHPPSGDSLVSPELYSFFTSEYNTGDQNYKSRDIYL